MKEWMIIGLMVGMIMVSSAQANDWISGSDMESGTIQFIGNMSNQTGWLNVSTGFKNPTSNTVQAGAGLTNPTYAYTDNKQYAQTRGTGNTTLYNVTSPNIPSDATITGIRVVIHGNCSTTTGFNGFNFTVTNTTTQSAVNRTGDLETTETTVNYNGSVLWGLTWTPTTANNIRINITGKSASSGFVRLEWVAVNISYTTPIYNETDVDKAYTTYEDVLPFCTLGTIHNISVTVNVTAFNKTASTEKGNTPPDLWLELKNGTNDWYSAGNMSVNNNGLFTIYIAEPSVLTEWTVNETNRDIRMRGRGFDAGSWDEINYTDVWVGVEDPIEISTCSVLDTAGVTYLLTADIIDSEGLYDAEIGLYYYCMALNADNITLDCQGHTIDGDGINGVKAVVIDSTVSTVVNITLKNCVLSDWISDGVDDSDGDGTYINIINNTIINCFDGVYISTGFNTIENNTLINNEMSGLRVFGYNSTFKNNTMMNNSYGMDIEESADYNNITKNIVQDNVHYGVGIYADSYNLIYNNIFNNSVNALLDTEGVNFWNTTQTLGARIYSSGTDIGGNYWTKTEECQGTSVPCEDIMEENDCSEQLYCYWIDSCMDAGLMSCVHLGEPDCGTQNGCSWNSSVRGYSDTCTDVNTDGFCDSPLNITTMTSCTAGVDCGDNVDYLPYSDEYSVAPSNCWRESATEIVIPNGCEYTLKIGTEGGP